MWFGGRLTESQATTRLDHLWPEIWSRMSKAAQRTEKQHWALETTKLDNARKLMAINFIDPEDVEYKKTVKHARKKLELLMVVS